MDRVQPEFWQRHVVFELLPSASATIPCNAESDKNMRFYLHASESCVDWFLLLFALHLDSGEFTRSRRGLSVPLCLSLFESFGGLAELAAGP